MDHVPRYLGLDIANCTGWALAEGSKIIDSGVRDFSNKTTELKGMRGIKFYNFLLSLGRVDEIFFEKIMFGGGFKNKEGKMISVTSDGRELYHGLLMVMEMYAAGFGISCQGIHPSTLKAAFAGHGHADKVSMCRAAREIGWQGSTPGTDRCHDEADAIGLIVVKMRERGVSIRF